MQLLPLVVAVEAAAGAVERCTVKVFLLIVCGLVFRPMSCTIDCD